MAHQRGSNVRDVRRSNRSLVLRHLYFQRLATRLDLSLATGLSPASVSNVIGEPGIVAGPPASVVHCQTIDWDAVPLERLLREVTDLPLFIDNGANTLAQAEMWFGAGRGSVNTLFILIGSGIGASVTVGGATYRGSSMSAGEWGHVTVAIGGRRCRCGARGCLEAYVGAASVIARYEEALGAADGPGIADQESALRRIVAAAGDEGSTPQAKAARTVLNETALYLGVGIGNLVNLFNPERVIIGGWAGLILVKELIPRVREAARDHALRYPYAKTTIELGSLGPDAVAKGAATLPVARFLETEDVRNPGEINLRR